MAVEEIADLKKQIKNLEAMLKATREVRCNTEYLKKVEELEWQLREVIEDNDYYQSQLDEAKVIIKIGLEGIKREFIVADNTRSYAKEAIKLCNEYCDKAEAFLKE